MSVCPCCCNPGDVNCIANNFSQLIVTTGDILTVDDTPSLNCDCAGNNVYVLDFTPQFQTIGLGCSNEPQLWLDSEIRFEVINPGYSEEFRVHRRVEFQFSVVYYFDVPEGSPNEPGWRLAFSGGNNAGESQECELCEDWIAREYSGLREYGFGRTNLTSNCNNRVFNYYLQ